MNPGDLIPVCGDSDGARYAVVLSTSRHKRTYGDIDARNDLHRMYAAEGDTLDRTARVVWHRHTRRVLDNGCMGPECAPGSWCEDGEGLAWVRVLCGIPLRPTQETERDR